MTITELITALEELRDERGDLDVYATRLHVMEPADYDNLPAPQVLVEYHQEG